MQKKQEGIPACPPAFVLRPPLRGAGTGLQHPVFQGLAGQIALQVFQGHADAVVPGDIQPHPPGQVGGEQQVGGVPKGVVRRQGLRDRHVQGGAPQPALGKSTPAIRAMCLSSILNMIFNIVPNWGILKPCKIRFPACPGISPMPFPGAPEATHCAGYYKQYTFTILYVSS